MIFDDFVFPINKKDYIKGKKPDVECILCSIVDNDKRVDSLVIGYTENIIITINLYPYNTGHIMIFPKRHISDIRLLNNNETNEIFLFTNILIDIIEQNYKPTGFNIGYNMGKFAGASIEHIHQHIIPRYPNELGIIDIIGGARVIIEDPYTTRNNLENYLKEYCIRKNINNIFFKN